MVMSVSAWLRYYPRRSCIADVQVLDDEEMPEVLRGIITPRDFSIMPEALRAMHLRGEGVYPDEEEFEIG